MVGIHTRNTMRYKVEKNQSQIKQVYRYWISKIDNSLHKEISFIQELEHSNNQKNVVIFDKDMHVVGDMSKHDFDNNMLKRTAGQFICFYKENDDLARKHFVWAANLKIKEAEGQIEKYKKIISNLKEDKDDR